MPEAKTPIAYVQGFVAAVPATNRQAYLEHATAAAALFQEHGATRVVEAWGDDVPHGELTDFRRAVKARPEEVVVFSWHEYPSKEAAHLAYERVMKDPRMEPVLASMPFDGSRMIYGGFTALLEMGAGGEAPYVDGSLLAVPAEKQAEYQAQESRLSSIILEYGATRIVDAWGDEVPAGTATDFPRAVQATGDEKVVFGWIEWPSKQVRDDAWRRIFADPRMHAESVPYDNRRRVHGGFAVMPGRAR